LVCWCRGFVRTVGAPEWTSKGNRACARRPHPRAPTSRSEPSRIGRGVRPQCVGLPLARIDSSVADDSDPHRRVPGLVFG
jgi:hypothetical protein